MKFLAVFLGGGLGSVFRFAISKYFQHFETTIPFGTLTVNVIGSFILGIVMGLTYRENALNQNQILFLTVGFCGGFTTFSSFAFENNLFFKNGDYLQFSLYTFASLLFGVGAIFLGVSLTK